MGRQLFATALDAFHAGKKVKTETNGCTNSCWGTDLLSLYILE
jgi:hypothetical protein